MSKDNHVKKEIIGILTIFNIFMLSLGGLLLSFRVLRSYFPIPMINTTRIIGFAQYNGYPLIFDTLLFFLSIICLFIAVCIAKTILKRWVK